MNSFLQSGYLFILLENLHYWLPKFQRENDLLDESHISAEDFVKENYSAAMDDIITCWENMTIQERKDIITIALKRINDERNTLTNIERDVISLGIEINQ